MDKFAEYQFRGQADALAKLGFPEDRISGTLVTQGLTKEAADEMVKEAALGALIGGGLRAAGRFLAPRAANLARAGASRAMAPAQAGARGLLGRGLAGAQRTVGQMGLKAGRGLASSGRAFQQAPLGTLGRGAVEAGKGALFMGGKGIGGTLGKGMFGASMYGALSGPGQVQTPQAYGGLAQYPPGYGR